MDKLKNIAYKTVLVAGILLSLLSAVSLLYDTGLWFLQVLNFPRLGFFIALAFCLVFALFLKKWYSIGNKIFIATVLAAISIQALCGIGKKELIASIIPDISSRMIDVSDVYPYEVTENQKRNSRA